MSTGSRWDSMPLLFHARPEKRLKRFCSECKVDENLTKAEASKRIDELQKKTGRGVNQDERQKAAGSGGSVKAF